MDVVSSRADDKDSQIIRIVFKLAPALGVLSMGYRAVADRRCE